MHLGRFNPQFVYKLDNEAIQHVNEEKDVGIVFDSHATKVSCTYSTCCRKANRVLVLIN